MNIVFMGTTEFSLKGLKALYESSEKYDFNIVAVYTRMPKPFGRKQILHKSIVHEYAESKGIPVFTPKSLRSQEQFEIFSQLKADVAIVSAFGLIIPQNILDIPKYGFINIHASLLPRWRGAAPIQAAILAGDKKSGVTIMKMDAGIDTGDIIAMGELEITQKTTHADLSERMGNLGAQMIIDVLRNVENNLANAVKQKEDGAIYAAKISKEDCRINWSNSAEKVLKQIMAFAPNPCAWTETDDGIRIKIIDADIFDNNTTDKAAQIMDSLSVENAEIASDAKGKIFESEQNMLIKCGDGNFLVLNKIQPAGKNIMSGTEFLRGRKNLVGKSFI